MFPHGLSGGLSGRVVVKSRSPASKSVFSLGLSVGLYVGLSGREVVKSRSSACKQVFQLGLSGGLSGQMVVKSRSSACKQDWCSSLVFLVDFADGWS